MVTVQSVNVGVDCGSAAVDRPFDPDAWRERMPIAATRHLRPQGVGNCFPSQRAVRAIETRERRERGKVCPECGDRYPALIRGALVCRHCLVPLKLKA
jgi:hypothetical protein